MSRSSRIAAILFFGLAAAVLALSLAPASRIAGVPLWDKAQHAAAYGALGFLGSLSFGRPVLVAAGLGGYGGLIELGQGLTPSREASWLDALANLLGAVAGTLLAGLFRPRLQQGSYE